MYLCIRFNGRFVVTTQSGKAELDTDHKVNCPCSTDTVAGRLSFIMSYSQASYSVDKLFNNRTRSDSIEHTLFITIPLFFWVVEEELVKCEEQMNLRVKLVLVVKWVRVGVKRVVQKIKILSLKNESKDLMPHKIRANSLSGEFHEISRNII